MTHEERLAHIADLSPLQRLKHLRDFGDMLTHSQHFEGAVRMGLAAYHEDKNGKKWVGITGIGQKLLHDHESK